MSDEEHECKCRDCACPDCGTRFDPNRDGEWKLGSGQKIHKGKLYLTRECTGCAGGESVIVAWCESEKTPAQRQALNMVLLQYTAIEGNSAQWWLREARDSWHQPIICTTDDIEWAMRYMDIHYWYRMHASIGNAEVTL